VEKADVREMGVGECRQIVETAITTFGRIDVLISNAGICPFHSFLTMPDALWKRVQAVNLDGAFYVTRAVANAMSTQTPRGGSIVAVSSISALMGGAEQSHYTPTKAGVKSLMESCAIALGPLGIRCNSVLPGKKGGLSCGCCCWCFGLTSKHHAQQARSKPTSTKPTSLTRSNAQTRHDASRSVDWARQRISLDRRCFWPAIWLAMVSVARACGRWGIGRVVS
jgi:NAD(P)-dependent dehydrogenase (short-subunit alcohol dehydrogenase family)